MTEDQDRFHVASDLRIMCMRIARRVRMENTQEIPEHLYSLLVQLEESPRSPRDLADRDGVSPPFVTRSVNELERGGYVERTDDPDDRRRIIVRLTERGETLIRGIRLDRDQWMASRVRALSDLEFTVLREATWILGRLEASS